MVPLLGGHYTCTSGLVGKNLHSEAPTIWFIMKVVPCDVTFDLEFNGEKFEVVAPHNRNLKKFVKIVLHCAVLFSQTFQGLGPIFEIHPKFIFSKI